MAAGDNCGKVVYSEMMKVMIVHRLLSGIRQREKLKVAEEGFSVAKHTWRVEGLSRDRCACAEKRPQ